VSSEELDAHCLGPKTDSACIVYVVIVAEASMKCDRKIVSNLLVISA
jgi:hypothetical protein